MTTTVTTTFTPKITSITTITGNYSGTNIIYAPSSDDPFASYGSNFTRYVSPRDADYYPGALNVDENGNSIINTSSTTDDFFNSAKTTSHNMGVPHFTEIQPEYPNPEFPGSLVDPRGTSDPEAPVLTPNSNPFLGKYINKIKQDPNFDGTDLVKFNHDFDPKSFLPDLNPYALMGDPRWSHGTALQQVTQHFLPLINQYLSSMTPGASMVNSEGIVCDCDGNPIRIPGVSSDITPQVLADYYLASSVTALPIPVTPKKLYAFLDQKRAEAYKNHADAFIRYLHKNYLDISPRVFQDGGVTKIAFPWKASLVYIKMGFFLVKLTQEIAQKVPRYQYEYVTLNTDGASKKGTYTQTKVYEDGYVGMEYPLIQGYNPDNIADRDDPDAPGVPGKPAVYDDYDNLISPEIPEIFPGRLHTIDQLAIYKRYYPDQRDYISAALGVPITEGISIVADSRHFQSLSSLSFDVPDYTTM